jgi:hypothetical protein
VGTSTGKTPTDPSIQNIISAFGFRPLELSYKGITIQRKNIVELNLELMQNIKDKLVTHELFSRLILPENS